MSSMSALDQQASSDSNFATRGRKGSEQYSLDDIIFEMESRPNKMNGGSESGVFSAEESHNTADIYAQLEQKERDLVLAAELGKALLDKNEELSKQNERIAEDFSIKLEELEQEKYHLRRRLEAAQEEYELKVNELQQDIQALQAQLDGNTSTQRQSEKEKSLLITTLSEQNQRLTAQLKEYTKNEETLNSELQHLRDQVNLKRTSMNEHVSHLDMLRDEITLMTERKMDLERRIELLQGEREGLSSTLDESADRIIMLEKEAREKDSILRLNEKTLEELRASNQSLQERLDNMCRNLSLGPPGTGGNMSLLNEMELSDSERSLNASRRPFSQIDEEIDDIECDNPEALGSPIENKELKTEMLSAFQQLRALCGQLRRREKQRRNSSDSLDNETVSSSSSDEPATAQSMKSGILNGAVQEIRGLIHDLLRKESKGACLACGGDKDEKLRLEIQLHKTTEAKEKLERTLKQNVDDAKRKDDEITQLKSKLSLTELSLSAAEEERDTLRVDVSNTKAGKDELIKKAWDVRDAAVKRKNNTQIELARSRIDVMQINSQLLEAIQQKVELSQQLDQWQADMEELLEEQMMRKMRAQERPRSGNDSDSSQAAAERKKSKILGFFQRS
ncbi:bicaudal D-related protein homolog [Tigriopus californicus]|uniref:bicaudal D-related protein homolog n=1 Tax=Tigriopus californicus TaxID=6832 RepID=UPI0027DA704B|nr:bicaudal D-related protein homolog [Tigriopus californicus]